MKPKTARRFLNRNKWKIAQGMGKGIPPSLLRRARQAKVALGTDPMVFVKEELGRRTFAENFMRLVGF